MLTLSATTYEISLVTQKNDLVFSSLRDEQIELFLTDILRGDPGPAVEADPPGSAAAAQAAAIAFAIQRANHTGTQDQSTIVNLVQDLALKADLVGGVVPVSQLPSIAITEYLGSVASESQMLALEGDPGDWAIRSDLGRVAIITGDDPSAIGDWTLIVYPASPVTSVNGQIGTVVLDKADIGLPLVDNTPDIAKPVSSPQAAVFATKQPLDGTLTALANLNEVVGVLEQTGLDVFTKRPIGVATSDSLLTRADGDGRYLKFNHVGKGEIGDRPSMLVLPADTFGFWYATDIEQLSVWDGDNWIENVSGGGGGGSTAVTELTITSNKIDVDCSLGSSFTLLLESNVLLVNLLNLNGEGFVTEIEIEITQDATGGWDIVLPSNFMVLGGSDLTIDFEPNAVTLLSAKTFDNGVTWQFAMQESTPISPVHTKIKLWGVTVGGGGPALNSLESFNNELVGATSVRIVAFWSDTFDYTYPPVDDDLSVDLSAYGTYIVPSFSTDLTNTANVWGYPGHTTELPTGKILVLVDVDDKLYLAAVDNAVAS